MSRTTPSSLGHIVLTGIFIGVAVLMFCPNLVVEWDCRSVSPGDRVETVTGDGTHVSGIVSRIEGRTVFVKADDGRMLVLRLADCSF